MADTLEIFGVEYPNVVGIIATNNNDTDLTYIRPQGTKSITTNGTGIDVTEYANVNVNVPSGQPTLQSKSYTVSSAGTSTVTADSGYDGLSSVQVSVPSLTLPISAVSSATGTKKGSVSTSLTTQYLNIPTGYNGTAQHYEIEPMDLGEKSITENGTYYSYMDGYDGYRSVTVNVSSGSSMNTQVAQTTSRVASTSYTSAVSLTCNVSGTYTIYWSTFRSSTSGAWGSQLYRGGTAYGSAYTTFTNHVQNVTVTNVQLTANQTVEVRARSRGTNYYAYVPLLVIVQTA